MMPRWIILGILLSCQCFEVFSQKKEQVLIDKFNSFKINHPKEFAYLQTDKKIYFNGESIHVEMTMFDQFMRPSQLSKVAYIEMIHEDDLFHKRYVFKVMDGFSNGHISIPYDIPTGNYQLVAYTYFMNNFSLEHQVHRRTIYIQQSGDAPKKVAKDIISTQRDVDLPKPKVIIRSNETNTRLFFEITSDARISSDSYVIIEGLNGIQLVAKTKLNRVTNNITIPKGQMKGSFFRMAVVDEDLQLLGVQPFYLRSDDQLAVRSNADSVLLEVNNNSISRLTLSADILHQDSIDLFRRTYQVFYQVPNDALLQKGSMSELISDAQLASYAKYSYRYWDALLKGKSSDLALDYLPERNIHLRGSLEGDLTQLEGAVLAVHFFYNGLDLLQPLGESGSFNMEIFWPLSSDQFFSTIVSESKNEISKDYDISFKTELGFQYEHNVDYHEIAFTDSIISNRSQFSYILSTYGDDPEIRNYFWEDKVIDKVIYTDDYRGIADFEEFVKEAITDLTVVSKGTERMLRIYNPNKGGFSEPQLIIVDNQMLNSSLPLFDIPIEKIASVRMTYSREKLEEFSGIFSRGIVILTLKEQVNISDEYTETYGGVIDGYNYNEVNEMHQLFNLTKLHQCFSRSELKEYIGDKKEKGVFQLSIESITQDGTYSNHVERVIHD